MRNEEIATLDFSGWPIPDEFLIEIGRVAALWASLESLLNICVGKLAGFNDPTDWKPFILITHSSFPQRLDMLGTLCEQLAVEFPQLAGYKKVISQLKTAQATRNQFMHYGMSYDSVNHRVEMAIGSARGTLKTKVRSISIEDIMRASIEINEAQRELYKLILRRDIPPPWQKRSSQK